MTESTPDYGDGNAEPSGAGDAVREGEDLTLEDRLRRLEQILGSLEDDDHSLDEALALFEEGIGHVRTSEALLDRAMLKVEELLDDDGTSRPLGRDDE